MPKCNGNTGSDDSGKPVVNGPEVIGNGGETITATGNSGSHPAAISPGSIGHNPDTDTPAGNASGGDSGPRKRGRPRGSINRNTQANTSLDLSGLQGIISSTHMAIAALSKNPLWALDEKEVKAYAEAVQNVSRHYDIAVQQKTLDHAMLCIVMAGIYGTRLVAMQRTKQATAATVDENAAAAHASGNVHQFSAPLQ